MKKKIYAKTKKPYLKLKNKNKNYNIVDIFAETFKKEQDPWMVFSSNYLNNPQKFAKVKSLDEIKLDEIIDYLDNYDDKVYFIKYLMNLKTFNPLTDYIPISSISSIWANKIRSIKLNLDNKNDYMMQFDNQSKNLYTKDCSIGRYYEVEDTVLRDAPFEVNPHLDFYICYDYKTKVFIFKTNTFSKYRLNLNELFEIFEKEFPSVFYKHGKSFFIKTKKEVHIEKNIVDKVLQLDYFQPIIHEIFELREDLSLYNKEELQKFLNEPSELEFEPDDDE